MFGDLPPSSTLTRLIESAALRSTSRPTADEPVNDTLSTPGWPTSAAPARAPPVTTWKTPSGRPASASSAGSRSAVSGVCSAGLSSTRAPGREGGRDLLHGEQQRVVPGRDRGDDADRLVQHDAQRVGRDRVALPGAFVGQPA